MSELELFPSDNESFITEVSPSQPTDPETFSSPAANNNIEPSSSNRGRRPSRSSLHTPRRRRLPSPPPARNSSSSSSSSSVPSHLSVHPNIPPIGKWTVKGLRQALINSDANFSFRMKKAELFNLYVTLQSSHPSVSAPIPSARMSKARRAPIVRPTASTPSSLAAPGPSPAPRRRRPSASLGRAPEPVAEGRQPFPGQLLSSAPPTVVPHAPDLCNSTFTHNPQMFFFPSTSFSVPPFQAPGAHPYVRMPPLAGQSPAHFLPLPLPHYALPIPPPPIPGADLCARMPPQTATAPTFPPFNPLQVRSPFSLFSATPQPAPPNAVAAEPPSVTNNIIAQILAVQM
ncbi:hypothetical protein PO909_013571 [Leuciscus waleckii]